MQKANFSGSELLCPTGFVMPYLCCLLFLCRHFPKYLFCFSKLKQASDMTFRKHFSRAHGRSGWEKHAPHECRPSTAALLAKCGIQPSIIQAIMRHAKHSQAAEYTHIATPTKIGTSKAITNALQTKKLKLGLFCVNTPERIRGVVTPARRGTPGQYGHDAGIVDQADATAKPLAELDLHFGDRDLPNERRYLPVSIHLPLVQRVPAWEG